MVSASPLPPGHRAAPSLCASSRGCFLGGSSILPSCGSKIITQALSKSLISESLSFGVFICRMEDHSSFPKSSVDQVQTECESGLKTINLREGHGMVIQSENVIMGPAL